MKIRHIGELQNLFHAFSTSFFVLQYIFVGETLNFQDQFT